MFLVSLTLTVAPAVLLAVRESWLSLWWLPLLWLAQVFGMTGLSNGAHEAVHRHLFYIRRLDRLAGRLMHGLLLLNFDVHQRYHLTHHASLGTDRDPEGVFDFEDLGSVSSYWLRVGRWALPPSPLHILNWEEGAWIIAGRPRQLAGQLSMRQALLGFTVPAATVGGLAYWLVSDPVRAVLGGVVTLFLLFPLFTYLTSLPEHFGLAEQEIAARTRNIRTLPTVAYLFWNLNLHAVHHRSPHLHFSLLPGKLDLGVAPTADGYLRFHADLVRQLGLPGPRVGAGQADRAAEALGIRL
jgi:fatty acid desaturase